MLWLMNILKDMFVFFYQTTQVRNILQIILFNSNALKLIEYKFQYFYPINSTCSNVLLIDLFIFIFCIQLVFFSFTLKF